MLNLHLPHVALPRNERGDAIVEVLVSIAVVSLVLVGAYTLSGRNVATTQDTQEHSQALQMVQAQAELLRSAGSLATGKACFDPNTGSPATGAACHVTPNGAGTQPDYTLAVSDSGGGVYKISASWQGLVDTSANNVTIYYQP